MEISVEIAWIVTVLLIAIRLAGIFLLTPVLAAMQVPNVIRVWLVMGLAVLLVSALDLQTVTVPLTLGQLFVAMLAELIIGGLLAFGIFAAFGAFLLGGRIIDMQMGFGVANLIDPGTREQTSMMGTFLNLLAVMVFFAIDGHHMLIRGLAYSLEQLPPGTMLAALRPDVVLAQFGIMFIYAVMVVAPALFAILLLDVGLGVMARTMPQVNIFIVSLPLKIFLGLTLTAVSVNYLGPVMERVFESIFLYWEQLLQ